MLEKPQLADEQIMACLRESYALPVTGIDFLPIGNDSTAWVYRVETNGGKRYFLKVKKGDIYQPSVTIPRYLKDSGIPQIVAPLLTTTRQLWASLPEFTLLLYPFIEGESGMQLGLSDSQWIEFGTVLKRIHSTVLPTELAGQVQRETFVPKWLDLVKRLHVQIAVSSDDSPHARELAAFWQAKYHEIGQIIERTETLGRRLQARSLPFVLCHTDIHTANILLDHDKNLFIVDWDTPLLAPKERDLMFIVDAAVAGVPIGTKPEALFFQGYGQTEIDPLALAYYRYEWVVQEFGDYGERVLLSHDTGAETQQDAVRGFVSLFQPGDVVEAAYKSMRE